MTDDARDAAIGRTVTEYRDKKSRLIALRSDLTRAGEALRFFGMALSKSPELIDFGGDSFSFSDVGRTLRVEKRYLDAEHLRAQAHDYRDLKADVERLAEQIQQFGLNP